MNEATRHLPAIELLEPFPDEVPAGGTIHLDVRVSCPERCDLGGCVLEVARPDEAVQTIELSGDDTDGGGGSAALTLSVPEETGDAGWTLTLPEREIDGSQHEKCVLTLKTVVVPHSTSLAVWGVPSPMRASAFSIKVGIKCSAGCHLAGQLVVVHDEARRKLGEGTLGKAPRPGTDALYEAELRLVAPDRAGVFSCSVDFSGDGLRLPHVGTRGGFTFRCLEPPEHTVSVRVVPDGVDSSLEDIEVRLGPYRAMTDSAGMARVAVAKGAYELSVWRIDLEPVRLEIDVTEDTEIEVGTGPRQVVDEDEERMWM